MHIYSDGDGGLFGLCMGSADIDPPTEADLDALLHMQDTEDAFECQMNQAIRTDFQNDLHKILALSAIVEAWKCVTRARTAAGY